MYEQRLLYILGPTDSAKAIKNEPAGTQHFYLHITNTIPSALSSTDILR